MGGSAHRNARPVGLITCVAAALPAGLQLIERPAQLAEPRWLAWAGCLAIVVFVVGAHDNRWSLRRSVSALAAASAAAVAASWLVPSALQGALLVVIAGILGLASMPRAGLWVTLQTLGFSVPIVRAWGVEDGLPTALGFFVFQLFALYAGVTAERERRGREMLERVNAELDGTRGLLEASVREAERLRIARDLHDVLGHHLTALALHLEVARHAPDAGRAEALAIAESTARRLLGEVRGVVGRLREDRPVPLEEEVAALRRAITRPALEIELAEALESRWSAETLEAVLRALQEIVTNAVRHAEATTLHIVVDDEDGDLVLSARDDGRGFDVDAVPVSGLGLQLMHERVGRLGGSVALDSRPGDGLRVTIRLPRLTPALTSLTADGSGTAS
ncbi:MAG: sensor histidine kinase [Acidobacteriota bacterium]